MLYSNLRDNEILLGQSRDNPSFAVYEGPSLILKAYMTAALTDIFGDVPYSEALQGKSGNVTPKYDKQEDIYLAPGGILDNFDKGIAAIQNYTGAQRLPSDQSHLWRRNRSDTFVPGRRDRKRWWPWYW